MYTHVTNVVIEDIEIESKSTYYSTKCKLQYSVHTDLVHCN